VVAAARTRPSSDVPDERRSRFAALVDSHREPARRLAWRLLGGDDAAAEDVTQEAFARAWEGLGRFRSEASLETWLYRIVVRQAHSYRRWQNVRRVWSGAMPADPVDPAPAPMGDPALRGRIARALESLTRPQREAFVLVHLEAMGVREAAVVMRRAEGTVKSHLHRALARLRKELGDLSEAEPGGDVRPGARPAAGREDEA
jgi:RNA polymerase sigma-70 factor (ECF subfamily)